MDIQQNDMALREFDDNFESLREEADLLLDEHIELNEEEDLLA